MRHRLCLFILMLLPALTATSQTRTIQHKPYIDLRPLHFGVLVGLNMQDIEFQNTGPQTLTLDDGSAQQQTILCDADRWNSGFSVGVLADMRLSDHLNLRLTPTMHFGAKHLAFRSLTDTGKEERLAETTQDMKNTYLSLPLNLKFSAQRFNNYRPYLMAGIDPMINLTSKNQEYIQLKRSDFMIEVGMGCDFYLPYFKLIPELKFCFSLKDAIDHSHADELQDANLRRYTNCVSRGTNKMVVLTFYFE